MIRIGFFANPDRREAVQHTEDTISMFASKGISCCVLPELHAAFASDTTRAEVLSVKDFGDFADFVLTFGGDGTLLMAARTFLNYELPLLGINMGRLGFLAEFTLEEIPLAAELLMARQYRLASRSVLAADVGDRTLLGINDIIVHKQHFTRLIQVHTSIDGSQVASYRGDGLIIATPTGSTAYSLSSGGPVISPDCGVVCLTPISCHSLTIRPLVVPDSAEITLLTHCETGRIVLSADGQEQEDVSNGTPITIRKHDRVVKLVKKFDSTYFELLKKKLLWSAQAPIPQRTHS